MNMQKLKASMVENEDTQKSLADALGISVSTLCRKINDNGAEFTQNEIDIIRKRYNLTPDQLIDIFLTRKYLEKILKRPMT